MTMNDTLNSMKDLTSKGMERMTSFGELNMRVFERMTAKQMEGMNLLMEQGNRMLTLATGAKGYNEFLKGQIEITQELSRRMMAESQANMAMAGQMREEYQSWFVKNMADVTADMRKSVPTL
jgi:hypothetical protein